MVRRKMFFGLLFLLIAAGAVADEQSIPHGSVKLVAPYRQISAGNPFQLGLLFRLEPGWHIYWKNPGDSGEPPRLTWQLPPGMQAREIDWPAPHRLSIPPLMDYGYEGQVFVAHHHRQ